MCKAFDWGLASALAFEFRYIYNLSFSFSPIKSSRPLRRSKNSILYLSAAQAPASVQSRVFGPAPAWKHASAAISTRASR
jgi:hypothetical protein